MNSDEDQDDPREGFCFVEKKCLCRVGCKSLFVLTAFLIQTIYCSGLTLLGYLEMGNEGKRKEKEGVSSAILCLCGKFPNIRQDLGELFSAVPGFFCTKSTSAKERGFILLKCLFFLEIFWTPVIAQQMNTRSTRWRGS